jgi:hypothetical protein
MQRQINFFRKLRRPAGGRPVYISGSPAVVHNSVKDSGFNTETAVFWSPERTWLDR